MLRSRTLAICCFFAASIATAQPARDEIRLVTGLSLGYSQFSFPEKLDHDISFPSVNVPIAIAAQNWQLSANFQTSLNDADISEEEDIGQASRRDVDITLGYQLSQPWTLFFGYKYGTTDIEFTPRDSEDDDVEFQTTNERYQQSGPFAGVSYRWQFEKAGSLSISVAYAKLNATNDFFANTDDDDEEGELEEAVEFDDISGSVRGDTTGISYSLSWTVPVSSNLVFQTRFKVNDYQQDIDYLGQRFEHVDETFTSLHVGVAYVF